MANNYDAVPQMRLTLDTCNHSLSVGQTVDFIKMAVKHLVSVREPALQALIDAGYVEPLTEDKTE